MAHLFDLVKPEVVDSKEFADALNANCAFKTDKGRQLSKDEIAILLITRLEKRIQELEAKVNER